MLEWEEVYEGIKDGTLQSEVDRIWESGGAVIFDVDVVGGLKLKKILGPQALALFVKVDRVEVLRHRLQQRGTENDESLQKRVAKAQAEMQYQDQFDATIVNNDLQEALMQAENLVRNFLDA
jgi:guanylate kinase